MQYIHIHIKKLLYIHIIASYVVDVTKYVHITLSNQKHPHYKKEQPRTKEGLAEKDVKSNGQPMPPGFDRFESFGHDEFTAKH